MISELPRSASEPVPEPGVTRREIIWPLARLRPIIPDLTLPRWLDPLIVLLVIGYLLGGIASAPFTLEEAVQTSLSSDAATLLTDPGSLLPGGAVSPTQESVRLAYGSFTRYSAAIGWYAAGARHAQAPLNLVYPGSSLLRGPDWGQLVAARAGPALLAVLAVLVVFVMIRRMLGRAAALAAVLIFGLHPSIALIDRQAVDAGFTLTTGLATILVAMGISTTLAKDGDPGLGAWTALAGLAGLTFASGSTAPPYIAGAVAFCLAGLIARQVRRRRELLAGRSVATSETGGPAGWLAASALAAVLIWVVVSPALWGWLPDRLETRHADHAALVAQQLVPDAGPSTLGVRLRSGAGLVTDPFLTPARLEQGERLEGYRHSWWSGLPLGLRASGQRPSWVSRPLSVLVGVLLTIMAAAGAVALWRLSRRQAAAMAGWALCTAGWLVFWPSEQVDQDLPVLAIGCLLAAASVPGLVAWLRRVAAASRPPDQAGDDGGGHPDQG